MNEEESLIDGQIAQNTLIRTSPEEVFDLMTTPDGLDKWLTTGSKVTSGEGARVLLRWKDWGAFRESFENGGPILEMRKPERFVFQWFCDTGDRAHPSTVEIDFKSHEEGTLVQLKEHGYKDTPTGLSAMLEVASGWGEALTLLKFYAEHKISTKRT